MIMSKCRQGSSSVSDLRSNASLDDISFRINNAGSPLVPPSNNILMSACISIRRDGLTDGEIVSSVSLILLHDEEITPRLPVAGTLEMKARV